MRGRGVRGVCGVAAFALLTLGLLAPAHAQTTEPTVDLSISITNGTDVYAPLQWTTYTVKVTNAGPDPCTGARVVVDLPDSLRRVSWSATYAISGSGGPREGWTSIDTLVDLAPGGSVTFKITGSIAGGTGGELVAVASVEPPAGTVNLGLETSASDIDRPDTRADLRVGLSVSRIDYIPGATLRYELLVTNNGPGRAPGIRVLARPPAELANVNWTAAFALGRGTSLSGTGAIDQLVDLDPGGSVTYRIVTTVLPGVSGPIANTASATVPDGTTDPVPGDTSLTVVNTLRTDLPSAPAQQKKADDDRGSLAGDASGEPEDAEEPSGPVGADVTAGPSGFGGDVGTPLGTLAWVAVITVIVFGLVGLAAMARGRVPARTGRPAVERIIAAAPEPEPEIDPESAPAAANDD